MEGQGFTLSLEGFDLSKEIKVNILNSQGVDVYQTNVHGKLQYFINEKFPTGVYVLNIENGFRKLRRKMIVK